MSKKKVKKRKSTLSKSTVDSNEYTLGSQYIGKDYKRLQQQQLDSLPVDDPDSIHFDERKYDKTEYHRQSMDWIDYDTSNELQQRYSINSSREYEQHSMDAAPFSPQHKESYYAQNAYKSTQTEAPHIEQSYWGNTVSTDEDASPPTDEVNTHWDEEDEDEMAEMHPSEGGDARKFIERQLKQQQENYKHWKELNENDEDNQPPIWNNALAQRYEDKKNWWNASSKRKYDMPHQALHGGVDTFDDESDIPLNSYWHKSTVSPDSWHMYDCMHFVKNKL